MNEMHILRPVTLRIGVVLLILAPASLPAAVVAPDHSFARYEVILSRKPFGAPPVRPVGNREKPILVTYNFYDDLHVVAMTERPRGRRVGFVNRKTRKDYFLYVGETEDGITLVAADFDEGKAIVRKGEQEGEIQFRKGMNAGPAVSPSVAAKKRTSPAFLRNRTSYLARLRERRARIQAAQAKKKEVNVLKGKDLEKHLQTYQMEVVRKGLPPLPIPLTEDMDRQLVKEGVLPAREED